ncbi:MAG: DUF2207 domain-containing protein [Microbacterium sp.]
MTLRLRSVLIALGAFVVLALSALPASAARADVDDFSYSSWDSRYEIGLDGSGRATMRVTETVVAEFPQKDQNRGIVRGLAERYGAAPLHTTVSSVRDAEGHDVPYETDSEDGVLFLSIDDDTFKHGPHTYVIEYTMRDVFHHPADLDIDEFYWDLLPLDSTQPIASFTGGIRFDRTLTAAMSGEPSCYQGYSGSVTACDVADDGDLFTVAATDLTAGEGITVAFPFRFGTVSPSPALQPDALTDVVPYGVVGGGLLAGGAGLLSLGLMKRRHRAQGRGVVVAQYEVPDDLPPLLAAEIDGTRAKSLPAEIVHLGVRGALRIEDGEDKPRLTLLDAASGLDPLDAQTTNALFPSRPPGSSVDLAEPDDGLVTRLSALHRAAAKAAADRGLTVRRRSVAGMVLGILAMLAACTAVGLAIPGLVVGRPAAMLAFTLGLVIGVPALVIGVRLMIPTTVLTPKGAEAREHLQGAREFIRIAEADRIRVLQSYSGAERRHDGGAWVIVLYERLLPYAILFGMEREWSRVLAVQYERQDAVPTWYTGYAIGSLGSSVSNLGSSLTATSTTTSSSSSGSFGGGFSGGGGGGGFSGGR